MLEDSIETDLGGQLTCDRYLGLGELLSAQHPQSDPELLDVRTEIGR